MSEYEQRKLDEIERSLHSDDPTLSTILNSGVIRRHRRVVAVLTFVGGLVALVAGAAAQSLPIIGVVVSVLGFVAMFGGAGLFVADRRRIPQVAAGAGHGAASHPEPSWRSRMEERFRNRFDQSGE